jgi:hypothetical protein
MSETFQVLTCPLEPHFHFYNCCPITCLNNSTKCKNNCIQLSTSQFSESAILSASEILYYKGHALCDPSIKNVNKLKKEGINNIQNLYTFNFYLEYIRNAHFDLRQTLVNSDFDTDITSSRILNILTRYPYNLKIFKINISDLVMIFTDSLYEEFCKNKKVNPETNYNEVICMTPEKLIKARKVLTRYLNRKEIHSYEFSKEED